MSRVPRWKGAQRGAIVDRAGNARASLQDRSAAGPPHGLARNSRYTEFVQIGAETSMQNVTITLKPEVAQWARVWAAQHNTSVSRMLGAVLEQKMREDSAYQRAAEAFFDAPVVRLRDPAQALPTRESLHER